MCSNSLMLLKDSPVISLPVVSIPCPRSFSLHIPSALKFSSASPSGSIRFWPQHHNPFPPLISTPPLTSGGRGQGASAMVREIHPVVVIPRLCVLSCRFSVVIALRIPACAENPGRLGFRGRDRPAH